MAELKKSNSGMGIAGSQLLALTRPFERMCGNEGEPPTLIPRVLRIRGAFALRPRAH